MKAKVGDRLVVLSQHLGEPVMQGENLEVHGVQGEPPFLVRWDDDGHKALVFPGPNCDFGGIADAGDPCAMNASLARARSAEALKAHRRD